MKASTTDKARQSAPSSSLRERLRERRERLRRHIELTRLRRIRKKKVPRYTCCKNCGTPLEGMYCYRCGQYALDVEQPFWKYIRQYFENVYQFDTKIWITLRFMFTRPGFLTTEFNAGKINSYVHPFRLYMCISVVFFALFFMLAQERVDQLTNLQEGYLNSRIVKHVKNDPASADTTIYLYQAPRLIHTLKQMFQLENAESLIRYQLVDAPYGLARVTLPRILVDSCFQQTTLAEQDWQYIRQVRSLKNPDIENIINGKDYGPENVTAIRTFPIDSIYTTTANGRDTLVLAPGPVYTWNGDKNAEVEVLKKERFTNGFMGSLSKWTPFYLMFLLPLFAWMLKVFYRHSRMPYMWHFVHAVHLNTVFLILISIPLVPLFAYGIDELLEVGITPNLTQQYFLKICYIGFPITLFFYMLMSFRTVYRQGWVKTFIKTLLFFVTFTTTALLIASVLLIWLLAIESDAI